MQTENRRFKTQACATLKQCRNDQPACHHSACLKPEFVKSHWPEFARWSGYSPVAFIAFMIWSASSEKMPSNNRKMRRIQAIPGLCSLFIHSVVSNDSVSAQCEGPDQTARMHMIFAWHGPWIHNRANAWNAFIERLIDVRILFIVYLS